MVIYGAGAENDEGRRCVRRRTGREMTGAAALWLRGDTKALVARAWPRRGSKRQRRIDGRERAGLAGDAVGRKVRETEREGGEQAGSVERKKGWLG